MKITLVITILLVIGVCAGSASATTFSMEAVEDYASSCPCTAIEFRVEFTNLYQKADTFRLSLDLPIGWSTNQAFVQPDIMLDTGESETIPVYVTPPCDAKVGVNQITLNARSALTANELSKSLNVETMKCYFASIDTDTTYRDVCLESDDGKTFDIKVMNEGKFVESYRLTSDVSWAMFSDSSVSIEPGREKSVSVVLNPPEGMTGVQSVILYADSLTSYSSTSEEIFLDIKDCFDFSASLTPTTPNTAVVDQQPQGSSIIDLVQAGENGVTTQSGDTGNGYSPALTDSNDSGDQITGQATNATGTGTINAWERMIVALIIIIVVLVIIYIIVKK